MPNITGLDGNDRDILGTSQSDRIWGRSGADSLRGSFGNDTIFGGEGRDSLYGGSGDDILFGMDRSDLTPGSGDIRVTRVGSGLDQPVFVTAAPGDPDRLFVVEKTGQIKILNPATGTVNATPFLDLPAGDIVTSGEQGLLGLAFHPDYATNGQFYVYVTNADGDLEVRRYERATANTADGASGQVVLTIPHPDNSNHNGGWLAFGPDGYLYIATGDGGGGGDPDNNAQNRDSLLGKILRIDVDSTENGTYGTPADNPFDGSAGADEIWAYGLRNPWRPSFDRATGDLYIADVGQNAREEINWQPGSSNGGENYGWVIREGDIVFDPTRPGNPGPNDPTLVDPVLDYDHDLDGNGGLSITGGYVYRGQSAGMQGVYFYADFVSNQLWSFRMAGGRVVDAANRTDQLRGTGADVSNIASFGEDGRGNLYIVQINGDILRLDPQAAAGDLNDLIAGGKGNDQIWGGRGNDRLYGSSGNDTLMGGSENDLLKGGTGADKMTGGAGADRFVFDDRHTFLSHGARDIITDLRNDDRIDLSLVDAKFSVAGDDDFQWIGTARFTAEGQVRAQQVGRDVILALNTRGDTGAEARIVLNDINIATLDVSDFIL